MPKEDADEKKLCRVVFANGARCRNDASPSGYCPGHEPSHFGAPWVAAIASAVSATMATITVAWPHIQPLLHTWLQNHSGFMSRAEILIKDVLASGDDPAVKASIQKRVDLLLEEAAELQRAVYAAQPVSAKTQETKQETKSAA